jgi:NAD(P)-dependent dehydrogenase (short-subunit alcohol dehydrogenase family)
MRGKGTIVNVPTMVADYGVSGMSLYGSKQGRHQSADESVGGEYGPSGVHANVVIPGATRTKGTEAMGEALDQLAAQSPAGRPAVPDEIAEAIVFLATDRPISFTVRNLRSREFARYFQIARLACVWESVLLIYDENLL